MNRRFLTALPVGGILVIALAACGGHGTGSGVPTSFGSDSAQASAAASAGEQLATRCQPKGESVQTWEVKMLLEKGTRQDFYKCEAIPKGDDEAVASCALTAAENAHKASGTSASKETGFISALTGCVNTLGVAPSASASASAS